MDKWERWCLEFLPFCPDIFTPIHNLDIGPTENMLDIQWDHDFHLCRNFTIYLNDTAVPYCTNITALNCTIRDLDTGETYDVAVVATETDTVPIEASMIAMLPPKMDPNTGM